MILDGIQDLLSGVLVTSSNKNQLGAITTAKDGTPLLNTSHNITEHLKPHD